jgi:hypothetical protein
MSQTAYLMQSIKVSLTVKEISRYKPSSLEIPLSRESVWNPRDSSALQYQKGTWIYLSFLRGCETMNEKFKAPQR